MSILNPNRNDPNYRNRNQSILPKEMKHKYRDEYTEADWTAEKRTHQRIDDCYHEQKKKIELEEAQRAAEEEKEPWPPVWKQIEESIQFKSGMIASFVNRHAIEDMDDSEFFSRPNNRAYSDADILNKLKRFFMLVRNTRGYDVDWVPPPCFSSPFRPVNDVHRAMNADHLFKKRVNAMLERVVDKINSRAKNHGEEYKVLKVGKIVWAPTYRMYLITFSVELVSHGGVGKDVQAMVRSDGGRHYTCVEWRFKPVEPGEDGPSAGSAAAASTPAADPEPPKKKKTKTQTKT